MTTETKAQAWRRLAVVRSRKANHYLSSLCKLTNRSHYEWTEPSVKQLLVLLFRSLLFTCEKYQLDPAPLFEAAQRHHRIDA